LKQNIIPTVDCLAKLWGVDAPFDMTRTNTNMNDSSISSRMISSSKSTSKSSSPLKSSTPNVETKTHDRLGRRIGDYPLILTLSLEGNIQPTINFYNRTGYIDLDDIGQSNDVENGKNKNTKKGDDNRTRFSSGVYLPARYLATSLFNRLLPRWNYYVVEESKRINRLEALHKKGKIGYRTSSRGGDDDDDDLRKEVIGNDGNDGNYPLNTPLVPPPLHLIASATDDRFCKQMGFDIISYTTFKDEAIPRLKFSSQFDTWLKTGRPIDV
jgi:hypothetical protein